MDTADGAGGPASRDTAADRLREHLERRRGEIGERIRELNERGRELAQRPMRRPSAEDLDRARGRVVEAREHARDAHTRAAERHEQASAAHLRAAELLDVRGRPDLARWHRDAAAADRAAGETERSAADAEPIT